MEMGELKDCQNEIVERIIALGACQMDCEEPEKSEAQSLIDCLWSIHDEFQRVLDYPDYRINESMILEKFSKCLGDEAHFFRKGLRIVTRPTRKYCL